MSRMVARTLLLLALSMQLAVASAETRAWLDRDRIALGETTTLNIETDQAMASSPDYSALMGDFQVSGNTSSRQFEMVNGVVRSRVVFAVALQPRREGLIAIAHVPVGNERIQPLTLTVTASTATPARAGDPVFIESEADAQEPYVQQAVGFTVRLFYAGPISGQLDQAEPDGATLQRIGEDAQYTRQVGNQTYNVLERHFLLIPERSGTLTIPAAHFRGTGAEGFFDDLIGNGGRPLRADSAPRFLRVLQAPADAPQPWLPLRALTLRYLEAPQHARAGEAVTVTVEATVDGATSAQLPPLQMSADNGAQVFAEPAQSDETFSEGRPKVRMVRRFSVVPSSVGTLHIRGPGVAWWDVRAGLRRTASLPDITVSVAPGANGSGVASPPAVDAGASRNAAPNAGIRLPGVQGAVQPWALATVLFATGWLLTLAWGLHRRQAPVGAAKHQPATQTGQSSASLADLKRALDHEDLGRVSDVLCALHTPPAVDLDAVRAELDAPAQIAAVDALQRARWGDGDGVAARAALRDAFKRGPRWRGAAKPVTKEPLPPLYPTG
ncbi:BatD family protein [Cognatiluteimonas profundi]|uniref:BatD family protein n=1 Tax=Cognatiluteimonas profundi TaxID=2594501 RepID=UPI00131AE544|nr:BatD family protein [Lysobacter profundi]